jgi:hypothetical protein
MHQPTVADGAPDYLDFEIIVQEPPPDALVDEIGLDQAAEIFNSPWEQMQRDPDTMELPRGMPLDVLIPGAEILDAAPSTNDDILL